MQSIETTPILKSDRTTTTTSTSSRSMQSFLIPISKGRKAEINFEALPIGRKDIDSIKAWLTLFTSSLTETDDETSENIKLLGEKD